MLDILSSLRLPPTRSLSLFVDLVCNHTVTPIVSLVSRPLEASSDHLGNGHGELWTGYTDYHVSSHVSCQVGRWVIVRVQEFNHRVPDDYIHSSIVACTFSRDPRSTQKFKLGYAFEYEYEYGMNPGYLNKKKEYQNRNFGPINTSNTATSHNPKIHA